VPAVAAVAEQVATGEQEGAGTGSRNGNRGRTKLVYKVHYSIQSKPLALKILFIWKLFYIIIIVQECRFSFNFELQILLVFTQHKSFLNLRLFTGPHIRGPRWHQVRGKGVILAMPPLLLPSSCVSSSSSCFHHCCPSLIFVFHHCLARVGLVI